MDNYYDISVVVLSYNPEWKKLRATLQSILAQEDVNVQIVIADDGSKDSLFAKVQAFFKEAEFKDYKFIAGKENKGTVCNFYNGISSSDAEYIKGISPGDLFFDKWSLTKWLNYTKENNADITFCDAVFYNIQNKAINIIKHAQHPQNVSLYMAPSLHVDRIINYIILNDLISGAATLMKTDLVKYYLGFLLQRVIYVDDYIIRLAILDNRNILYYPQKGIWYEFADGGISTSGETVWQERMYKDYIEMNKITLEYIANRDKRIRKWLKENYDFRDNYRFSGHLWDRIKRYLYHPKWLYWRLYQRLNYTHYSPVNVDNAFLRDCFAEELLTEEDNTRRHW